MSNRTTYPGAEAAMSDLDMRAWMELSYPQATPERWQAALAHLLDAGFTRPDLAAALNEAADDPQLHHTRRNRKRLHNRAVDVEQGTACGEIGTYFRVVGYDGAGMPHDTDRHAFATRAEATAWAEANAGLWPKPPGLWGNRPIIGSRAEVQERVGTLAEALERAEAQRVVSEAEEEAWFASLSPEQQERVLAIDLVEAAQYYGGTA